MLIPGQFLVIPVTSYLTPHIAFGKKSYKLNSNFSNLFPLFSQARRLRTRFALSVLRSPFSVLRSPFFRFPFSAFRFPFSAFRFPLSVLRSPFSVLRSPFSVLRFQCVILNTSSFSSSPSLTVPLLRTPLLRRSVS